MKNKFLSLILITLLLPFVLSAETVKMGYFSAGPHSHKGPDGKAAGGAIYYFEQVAKKMGVEVEWIGPFPFARMLKLFKEGKIDGTLLFSYRKEREAFALYPKVPFYKPQPNLVFLKSHPISKIEGDSSISGLKIGYMFGAAPSKFIAQNSTHIKLENLSGKDTTARNLQKMLKGRLDAVHEQTMLSPILAAKSLGISDKIKIIATPDPAEKLYFVFSKAATNGAKFLGKYDKATANFKLKYLDYYK